MLQEFFTTSIYCKAIKYLLSKTPLPMYKTISTDEFIIEGCTYIYKDKILRCTKSGRFLGINASTFTEDHLYVNEHLTISDDNDYIQHRRYKNENGKLVPYYEDSPLCVTDDIVRQYLRPFAEYEILDDYHFGEFVPGITEYHISNTSYYDSRTHRYLGEYLRCLRDIKDIDLMALYNCFDYEFVNNVYITPNSKNYLSEETPSKYKVTLVPIKFNKQYTIAINCPFRISVKSVFYKDYLIKNKLTEEYLTSKLNETYRNFNNLSFDNPVTYQIEVDNPDILQYEKYLYLAIQIPAENNSSIVVIEGNYTVAADKYVSDINAMEIISAQSLSNIFKTQLSLLEVDDNKQHPFSDKLIEYLLGNTIDNRDEIDENITTIEKKVGYHPKYYGSWSNTLRYLLYNKYMNINKNKKDILGFVDSDIEEAIHRGYIKNA